MKTSGRMLVGLAAIATAAATVPPAAAGDTGSWSTVDTGVTNISRPGLLRSPTSLGVYWSKGGVGTTSLSRRTYSAAGVGGPITPMLTGWDALGSDPIPTALGTATAGLRGNSSAPPFWDGRAFLTDDASTILGALSSNVPAYAGDHDMIPVADKPVFVYSNLGKVLVHAGLQPAAEGSTQLPGTGTDHVAADGPCCAYQPAIRMNWWIADAGTGANADSSGWLAWYVISSTPGESGWLVRKVDHLPGTPAFGPVQQAPGALTGGGSVAPSQRAALVSSKGKVWLAYPLGYPTPEAIRVWEVGTSNYIDYDAGMAIRHVALSADALGTGRLWLTYYGPDSKRVYSTRTDAGTPTKFGTPSWAPLPRGTSVVYSTAVDGRGRIADVVVNTGSALHHKQFQPGLTAWGSARKLPKKPKVKVKVWVKDAGDPVAGAKVKIRGGGTTKTGPSGKATLTFAKRTKAKKVRVKVTRSGYFPAKFSVKVK